MSGLQLGTVAMLAGTGAVGGLLYACRGEGVIWPHIDAESKTIHPGVLGDLLFGAAGGVAIFLLLPGELTLQGTAELVRVIALALVGGYGGRAVLDRALSMTMREIAQKTQEVAERQSELEAEQAADQLALRLTAQQLEHNAPEVPEADLVSAIAAASEAAIGFVFQQASELRRATWRNEKAWMERTMPVFRALLQVDDQYHRYHAQLGYALKDKRPPPDYAAARASLDTAIRLRDQDPKDRDWYRLYELNRALCTMGLDNEAAPSQPSDPQTREAVCSDLREAAPQVDMERIVKEPVVSQWLARNNMDPASVCR